jgi:hypothetical protein
MKILILYILILIVILYNEVVGFYTNTKYTATSSSLSMILNMPFDDLSLQIGGSGKAKTIWELLKKGIDPLDYNNDDGLSNRAKDILLTILQGQPILPTTVTTETLSGSIYYPSFSYYYYN